MSARLFTPIELRDLQLPNRIAVSPMCQYVAEEGSANDWHLMHIGQFAMGAAGLVITEATHVSPEGRITHGCLGLWSDENEAAIARVIALCRKYGVAKLGMQLAHAGRKGSAQTPLQGGKALSAAEGAWQTIAPSALAYAHDWHVPKAADEADIAKIRDDFAAAAGRAARLGLDLIELHMAHGYLLHQFLSPLSNHREDRYGGDLEGRLRLPLEVFDAVREVWPADRPLGVRVSATDWVEGGWDLEQTIELVRRLQAKGCDFVDVSTGGLDPRQKLTPGPGYQVPFAQQIKAATGATVMAVGMIVEPRQAESIIAEGQADLVALARAAMDDPHWAWHAARELGAATAYPPQYVRAAPATWPPARPRQSAT